MPLRELLDIALSENGLRSLLASPSVDLYVTHFVGAEPSSPIDVLDHQLAQAQAQAFITERLATANINSRPAVLDATASAHLRLFVVAMELWTWADEVFSGIARARPLVQHRTEGAFNNKGIQTTDAPLLICDPLLSRGTSLQQLFAARSEANAARQRTLRCGVQLLKRCIPHVIGLLVDRDNECHPDGQERLSERPGSLADVASRLSQALGQLRVTFPTTYRESLHGVLEAGLLTSAAESASAIRDGNTAANPVAVHDAAAVIYFRHLAAAQRILLSSAPTAVVSLTRRLLRAVVGEHGARLSSPRKFVSACFSGLSLGSTEDRVKLRSVAEGLLSRGGPARGAPPRPSSSKAKQAATTPCCVPPVLSSGFLERVPFALEQSIGELIERSVTPPPPRRTPQLDAARQLSLVAAVDLVVDEVTISTDVGGAGFFLRTIVAAAFREAIGRVGWNLTNAALALVDRAAVDHQRNDVTSVAVEEQLVRGLRLLREAGLKDDDLFPALTAAAFRRLTGLTKDDAVRREGRPFTWIGSSYRLLSKAVRTVFDVATTSLPRVRGPSDVETAAEVLQRWQELFGQAPQVSTLRRRVEPSLCCLAPTWVEWGAVREMEFLPARCLPGNQLQSIGAQLADTHAELRPQTVLRFGVHLSRVEVAWTHGGGETAVDLSVAQFCVVVALDDLGGCATVQELQDHLTISSGCGAEVKRDVQAVLEALSIAGLVERTPSDSQRYRVADHHANPSVKVLSVPSRCTTTTTTTTKATKQCAGTTGLALQSAVMALLKRLGAVRRSTLQPLIIGAGRCDEVRCCTALQLESTLRKLDERGFVERTADEVRYIA